MGFTYQGHLTDANLPANGFYDFEFKLFDAPTDGNQVGATLSFYEVLVDNGYFMVELDFVFGDPNAIQPQGAKVEALAYQEIWGGGEARWLEIAVRPALILMNEPFPEDDPLMLVGSVLSPRQKITPTPYAFHALSSGTGSGQLRLAGTDNYIPRWLGTTGLEDSVIYQTDTGNVGIGPGMTNPEERLDVSWSGGVNARVGRYNYLGSCFSSAALVIGNNVRARTDGVNGIVVGQPHDVYGYRAITMSMNGIQFYGRTGTVKVGDPLDAATERMRITNEGNVGIGTTAPRSILEVVGEVGNPVTTFTTFPTSGSALSYGTQGIGLNLVRKSTGTWEAAGDGSHNAGAAIFGSIGHEGLRFVTVESTGSVNQTFTDSQIMEKIRMVINSAGNVGIGTTNPRGYKLNVAGTAYATGTWQSSDLRFKENIKTIDSPIDKIGNIRGVSFEWKTSEYKDKGFPEGRHYGVIAQEIEHTLPDVVKEGPDGEKAVSYTDLVPILAEAIKEQQKQIESLRCEVQELREVIQQHRLTATKEVLQ
jgi:hypothetical protein